MFKKIISKHCETPGCKSLGVIVDTSLNLCEDCGSPLRETTALDRRKLIPTVLLVGLLVSGSGYLGVLGVKRYLLGVAAQTTGTVAQIAREQIEEQIKILLRQQTNSGAPNDALKARIEQLARQHGISQETLAQWRTQTTA